MKLINYFLSACILSGALYSCSSGGDKEDITVEQDENNSLNTNFDGKIFSIPSPILTMLLLKKVSPAFQPELLHSVSKADSYQTEQKRALMLGVYGADLGYASIYQDKIKIMDYLVTVEKITNSLGLEASFNKEFIERYQKNAENSDSMMHIISDAFRNVDLFLKNGNRKSVSALILAGGWIESMHFATTLAQKSDNVELTERIAEQKQTLTTLISLLDERNKQGANDEIISLLKELNVEFEKIQVNYEYREPETDAKKKLTVLKHDVSFEVSKEVLSAISKKMNVIRQHIIE